MATKSSSRSARLWSLAAATTALSLPLAGCGGAGTDDSVEANPDSAELRMMVSAGGSGRAFAGIAERFTEETGIPVQVDEMALDDLRQQEILDLSTGAGNIDVVVVNNTWLGEMSDYLVDLSEDTGQVPDFDRGAIVPSMLELFASDGQQYALPVRVGGRVLVYREDLFDAANIDGPPQTWEEFRTIAETLTDPDASQYGFVAPMRQGTDMVDTWSTFLTSFGGSFVEESGEQVAFNSEEGRAATELFVDLFLDDAVMPPDSTQLESDGAITEMAQGRAAMFLAYSPWISQLMDEDTSTVADSIAVSSTLPSPDGSPGLSMLNGWGFGVNVASGNQEAARQFVEFAASPDTQLFAALEHNNDPTASPVFENADYLAANPHAEAVLTALDGAKAQPALVGWAAVSEELARALGASLAGQMSPGEALEEAVARGNAVLSQ